MLLVWTQDYYCKRCGMGSTLNLKLGIEMKVLQNKNAKSFVGCQELWKFNSNYGAKTDVGINHDSTVCNNVLEL